MDFLKAAIASSKQKLSKTDTSAGAKRKADEEAAAAAAAAADEPAPKKFKSRGEIEAERQAKLAKEKEERIKARQNASSNEYVPRDKRAEEAAAAAATTAATAADASSSSGAASSAESAAEAGMISANEVKRRLRSYNEPITLFGETDLARFQRLKLFELVQHEKLTSSHGRKNVFAQILLQDVESEIKAAMMKDLEEERKSDQVIVDAALEADASAAAAAAAAAGSSGAEAAAAPSASSVAAGDAAAAAEAQLDETGKIIKTGGSRKTDYRGKELRRSDFDDAEDFILYFFKRMLGEWEAELDARPKEVRLSERGKMASATQKQTRQFIRPLFKLLKTRTTSTDILKACEKMVTACLERNYNLANEAYLTMAIGNAAWPMGVTMVSIHERAGRTKLFSGQVAHVLNDETQRKYIQSVKRLMTYCQEHYPSAQIDGK